MKPSEIYSLRTSSIGVLASGPTSVWKLNIESRPLNIREIILLPPVQEALEQYFATRGITGGAGVPGADSPVIASSRDMKDWLEIEANLAEGGARSATQQVFLRAAELAGAGGDNTAMRRLSAASIHWLRHAFEINALQMNTTRNWCWHLLGARWLATPIFRTYLPARTPLSAETCLEAFEELRSMWHDTSDWTRP